jgi:hypothetical protein
LGDGRVRRKNRGERKKIEERGEKREGKKRRERRESIRERDQIFEYYFNNLIQ